MISFLIIWAFRVVSCVPNSCQRQPLLSLNKRRNCLVFFPPALFKQWSHIEPCNLKAIVIELRQAALTALKLSVPYFLKWSVVLFVFSPLFFSIMILITWICHWLKRNCIGGVYWSSLMEYTIYYNAGLFFVCLRFIFFLLFFLYNTHAYTFLWCIKTVIFFSSAVSISFIRNPVRLRFFGDA